MLRSLLFVLAFAATSTAWADDRPNVIIIFADDLGYGDLACYGHPKFKTPNLDRMAAAGAKLTHFYVSCPYCAPSRAALQTGRYQFRCRMTKNPFPKTDLAGIKHADNVGLPQEEITLGEAFQQAGYRTAHVGKWHLGHQPQFYPTRNGYDAYFGILYSNDMHPVELYENEKVIEYPVVQATLTKRYTERSLSFIEQHRKRPFFLYLAHAMPHKPLACSEDFYKKSGNGLYADVIAELDWSVGRILAKLKELDLDKQTLVFFTSDNGPWYGGSTGGFRGMKGRTFEGGIRVPLIAHWPGRIPAGHTSSAPAIIMDLFTTSLAAAGIDLPQDRKIDGKNIMPLLTSAAESPHEVLFAMRGSQLQTVRSGKWKLHVRPPGPAKEKVWKPTDKWRDPRGPDGLRILAPFEQGHPSQFPGLLTGDAVTGTALFDLDNDSAEQHNLADEYPEIVRKLQGYAAAFEAEMKQAR